MTVFVSTTQTQAEHGDHRDILKQAKEIGHEDCEHIKQLHCNNTRARCMYWQDYGVASGPG
jgi:hypothetical protein